MNLSHPLYFLLARWHKRLAPALLAVSLLAACGGGEDPTPTPLPPAPVAQATDTPAPALAATDTPAPVEAPVEPESPLQAPESPLPAPDSPLQAPDSPLPQPESAAPAANNLAELEQLAAELKAEAPSEGMASVSGLLYAASVQRTIPDTHYYLTKAIEDNGQFLPPAIFIGPQRELGDVPGVTDTMARFTIKDVEPGKYYLAVWSVYSWPLAQEGAADGDPLLIELKPNETLDLGIVNVTWP